MTNWKARISVKQEFEGFESNGDFEAARDAVVAKLQAFQKTTLNNVVDEQDADAFEDIVLQLENSDDLDEFDGNWDNLYDWADDTKVWVEAF